MKNYHISVLLEETINFLNVKPGKKYIDATIGGGGHTEGILERGGKVLGLDVDQESLEWIGERFKVQSSKFKVGEDLHLARGNFKDIGMIAREEGFGTVAGIIFDLGVSSHQLDTAERGFSFAKNGPLDMRMDQKLQIKASDLINILTKGELYELFTKLGEERFARSIANCIVRARRVSPIKTTAELSAIVSEAVPIKDGKINPATRVFQALRIAVNDELNSLRETLPEAVSLLEPGGRMCVISFHSLEDRIVKNAFKSFEEQELGRVITKKPVLPGASEVEANKRSRSAKLRVFEKN